MAPSRTSSAEHRARTAGTDTRQSIIEAAWACFRRFGMRRTTIVDIGRAAMLSRGTIYQYFKDKADIVEAAAESVSQKFYRQMARAMDEGTTLEEKLSNAGAFVAQARRVVEKSEQLFDEDEISLLLTKNAGVLLRECVDFLAPYITAAKLTGEVRRDLDARAAGEWFARILFSLFSTPASTLEMDDLDVVRRFVRDHVVRGFAADGARSQRRFA